MAEFNSTIATLNGKLKPVLEKVRSKQVDSTAEGMSYLEMKYNLLLTYCQFLSVFITLKLEGKPVKDHPVINRLLHIKTLLERLRPLDLKLQYQIEKLVRTAALAEVTNNEEQPKQSATTEKAKPTIDALQYKPNIENLMESAGSEQSEEEEDEAPSKKKDVFKAAKLNPVLYEDKQTKKQRREELFQRKKASNSDYVNELRREIYDLPEEVHLGGMASQESKFAREQDVIEKYELENYKRVQFTKKEIKE